MDPEITPAAPSSPIEATDLMKSARRASESAEQFLLAVFSGRRDAAAGHAQLTIAAIAEVLKVYGLELAEVLPLVPCSSCSTQVTEYRRAEGKPLCMVCLHEQSIREDIKADQLTREGCLELAREAVDHRGKSYGPPGRLFATIAQMWGALLGQSVTASDVARCMIALKLARLGEDPKHADSWADAAGYAACGAETVGGGW